jgi:exodeoxyribonuclease X
MPTRILIADTETTGLGSDAEICELGYVEVDTELHTIRDFESLINPKGLISPAASGVHGITNKMVESAPSLEQVVAEDSRGFESVVLIAHNAPFDARFLRRVWNIVETLDTLKLARQFYPKAPDHKLQTLRYYLDLEVLYKGDAHSALFDVYCVYALLVRMVKDSGRSLEELIKLGNKPVEYKTMPWGKHKGVALDKLPPRYVTWLLGLPDLDSELRASLEKVWKVTI